MDCKAETKEDKVSITLQATTKSLSLCSETSLWILEMKEEKKSLNLTKNSFWRVTSLPVLLVEVYLELLTNKNRNYDKA